MLPATRAKRTGKVKQGERTTGICDIAKRLGVERTHLYRVLTGKRASASLLRRYTELLAKEAMQ